MLKTSASGLFKSVPLNKSLEQPKWQPYGLDQEIMNFNRRGAGRFFGRKEASLPIERLAWLGATNSFLSVRYK